ncbi:MAG: DUF423 domain-containing protein [Planctomycetaceae bacterium]|nr:DUF423 domain-containing protein [Planctomycetaceae bacterium]
MAGLAVILGAFGAHGLDKHFEKKYAQTEAKKMTGYSVPAAFKYMQDFKTGVRYHMWHALGLIAVGLAGREKSARALSVAGWCFSLGIIFFSGALYVLTIMGSKWLGVTWGLVAPLGGTLMIIGWFALAAGVCCCRSGSSDLVSLSQPAGS